MTDTTTDTDTRPLLERARDAMPELATIEQALADVEERLRQARAGTSAQPEQDVVNAALPGVLAGEPIPADLGDRVLSIRRQIEATAVQAQALTRLQSLLHAQLRQTHARHADLALAVLRRELHGVLTAAAPVLAELGDVSTADAAIAADRAEQWRHARQLGEQHGEVRLAQLAVVADALDLTGQRNLGPLVVDYGHVKNSDKHDSSVGVDAPVRDEVQIMVTYVGPPDGTRPWHTGNPVADLRFLLRDDVEAWLPSIVELTSARAAHRERKLAEARAAAGVPEASGPPSMFETSGRPPRTIHDVRRPSWVTEVADPWRP